MKAEKRTPASNRQLRKMQELGIYPSETMGITQHEATKRINAEIVRREKLAGEAGGEG